MLFNVCVVGRCCCSSMFFRGLGGVARGITIPVLASLAFLLGACLLFYLLLMRGDGFVMGGMTYYIRFIVAFLWLGWLDISSGLGWTVVAYEIMSAWVILIILMHLASGSWEYRVQCIVLTLGVELPEWLDRLLKFLFSCGRSLWIAGVRLKVIYWRGCWVVRHFWRGLIAMGLKESMLMLLAGICLVAGSVCRLSWFLGEGILILCCAVGVVGCVLVNLSLVPILVYLVTLSYLVVFFALLLMAIVASPFIAVYFWLNSGEDAWAGMFFPIGFLVIAWVLIWFIGGLCVRYSLCWFKNTIWATYLLFGCYSLILLMVVCLVATLYSQFFTDYPRMWPKYVFAMRVFFILLVLFNIIVVPILVFSFDPPLYNDFGQDRTFSYIFNRYLLWLTPEGEWCPEISRRLVSLTDSEYKPLYIRPHKQWPYAEYLVKCWLFRKPIEVHAPDFAVFYGRDFKVPNRSYYREMERYTDEYRPLTLRELVSDWEVPSDWWVIDGDLDNISVILT